MIKYDYMDQKMTIKIYYKKNNPRIDFKLNNIFIARSRYINNYDLCNFIKETKKLIRSEIIKHNKEFGRFKNYNPKLKKLRDIKNALILPVKI